MSLADGMNDDEDRSLLRRVARIEAIEEIRKLKCTYAAYCDDGYPAGRLGSLYTEDAVFDGGPFGCHVGRQAIEEFYAGASETLPWATHLVTNDVIDVADDFETASGTWALSSMVTMHSDDGRRRPMWIVGVESDKYVRQGGRWLFSHVRFELRAAFDARLAWHEELVQL